MMLRKLGLWVAAMALACVSPAFAQNTGTITFKNATGQVVTVACQMDASNNCHYRDVFEGLLTSGLPAAATIDGTDSGLWSHITNWPSAFGLTGALPAGTNAIGSVTVSNLTATQAISAAALPLPAGAATQATLAQLLAALGTPLQAGGSVTVSNLPTTQPVSAAGLPLPTGAATSANQTTNNASAAQTATAAGTPADAPYTGSNTASLVALLKANLAVEQALLAGPLNIGGSVTFSGSLPAGANAIGSVNTVVQASATDRGGTLTTGGTAQQLMAANASRRGWSLQNQSSGALYVNCSATATQDYHSLLVAAGGFYETPSQHVGTGVCSIIGATTGQAFYGREF